MTTAHCIHPRKKEHVLSMSIGLRSPSSEAHTALGDGIMQPARTLPYMVLSSMRASTEQSNGSTIAACLSSSPQPRYPCFHCKPLLLAIVCSGPCAVVHVGLQRRCPAFYIRQDCHSGSQPTPVTMALTHFKSLCMARSAAKHSTQIRI
jgi:hypothetical protein